MTDEQIVRTLAEKLNWRAEDISDGEVLWWLSDTGRPKSRRDARLFLHSYDALRPVLEKLTPEEWEKFSGKVWEDGGYTGWPPEAIRAAFATPPVTLARLIAEAIVECRPNLASSEADRPKEGTNTKHESKKA